MRRSVRGLFSKFANGIESHPFLEHACVHIVQDCREAWQPLSKVRDFLLHRLKCRTAVVRIEKYLLSSVTVAFGVSVLLMVLFSVSGPVNGWFCWARRAVLSYACQLRLHIALIRSGFISFFNFSCHPMLVGCLGWARLALVSDACKIRFHIVMIRSG